MSAEPTIVPFDKAKISDKLYLPGRREWGEVVNIIGAGRRRSTVEVLLDSGLIVGYPRMGWHAMTGAPKLSDTVPRARHQQPVPLLALPAARVALQEAVPNPVRQAVDARRVVASRKRRNRVRPPAASTPQRTITADDLPEIPGPPVPLPIKAKPARGLWT